jgi:hypothetical protein
MLSDTTKADLELLLAEVDNGWCAYTITGADISFGIGGCLVEEMHRLLVRQQIPLRTLTDRKYDMIAALGFITWRGDAYAPGMFAWNDTQRDPDAIKRRIKDALNGELNVK